MATKTVDSILKGIVNCLEIKGDMTPAALGKALKIHPKTASRYVEAAEKLHMITYKPIQFGKNTVKLCRVNPTYTEFTKKD